MKKRRISFFLVFFLIFNLFSSIVIKTRTVQAEELPNLYNEIGVEYTAKNNLTVTVEEIKKVEGDTYDTYTATLKQKNNTNAVIEECPLVMYFHDRDKEITTSFLRDINPNEEVIKKYEFRVDKKNIPWVIAYQEDFFDNDFTDNLKWDVTPDQFKGKSSNTNLKTIETNYGNVLDKINVPSTAETININPVPEDDKATATGGGTYNLNYGDNTINIEVTSEMGTKKSYTLVIRRLSSNANLSSLTFSEGTISPEFNKDITEYNLKLNRDGFSLSVRALAEDSKAKVSYIQYIYVNGASTQSIKVTAEDGTSKTYTINILPPSKDANLKNIILNDGEIPFTFNPSSSNQSVTVNEDVTTLKIEAITNDPNATINSGNGTFTLKEGKNQFSIRVDAAQQGYYKYYTLDVYKQNNNNNLKNIFLGKDSYSNLITNFNPNITEYEVDIIKYNDEPTNRYTIYGTPENYKSELQYEFNGTASESYIDIGIGTSVAKIKCISEQGEAKEYTITINCRQAYSNAKIESIKFDKGIISPAFNPDIKDYTITVPRNTYDISVVDIKTIEKVYWISNSPDGSYSSGLNINEPSTTWTFKVTSEDGKNTEYYNFKIVKEKSSDSSLSGLFLNGGTLKPNFDKNIKEYSTTVHSSYDTINIGANASDYKATVTGDGEKKLNFGNNKFTIKVTAEDGSICEYFIDVYRNNPPVISGGDITITIGDEVDLLKGITATDVEDGNITSKIKVFPMQSPIIAIGTYDIMYSVTDSFGEVVYKYIKLRIVDRNVPIKSAIGSNRYDTAVKLSQMKHTKSNIAVLVNGYALADGLAVTPLAVYYNAPILLTTTDSAPQTTVDELKRLGVTKVIIAGGKGVVSSKVENQLKGIGISNIDRLAGSNRYETSLEIAKYIDKNCFDVDQVAVCYGYGEADALSISAVAGRDRMAIIMSDKGAISPSIEKWLVGENLSNAYIVGGTGVVSDNVLNKMNSITNKDIRNNRLGGSNRYHTNTIILNRFYGKNLNSVYVAKGEVLVDALAAGGVAALSNGPVMLVKNQSLTDVQEEMLNDKIGNEIIRAGGGISDSIINTLKRLLEN